ncbi:MAG: response regulator [Dysgonamonadaceae bacterium]|jgi:signal transduction histidine kinase/ligand-binding sensor domain-containing protein/DNA-binding response OmpR family regulator|nr:response regulator [Dysgonamonadaceae bacterium]
MKTVFAVLLFSFISVTTIRPQSFEFAHLDITDGLSNNQVDCIFKDSRGFMWFSTNSGLNRYDGKNFEVYKHNKHNPNSAPVNRFIEIMEDNNGNLWLKSWVSYFVYDWKGEYFIRNTDSILAGLRLPPNPDIIKFDKEKNQYLYYKDTGIYKYVVKTGEIIIYEQSDKPQALSRNQIVDFEIVGDYLWILFKDGAVERINEKTGIMDIRDYFLREKLHNSTIPKKIFTDADGDLWIYPGIGDKGLVFFNTEKQEWLLSGKAFLPSVANVFIRNIIQDDKELIWIGTDHEGITVFDKKNSRPVVLRNNVYNKNSISQNSVISLFCDDMGMVWAGSYKNGVSYYHPAMFKFQKSPLYVLFNEKGETFDCNSICKDGQNNLWLGTNDSGLIKYNPQTNKLQTFKNDPNNPNSLSSNIITCIYQDKAQTLWIGTFLGGLNAYDGKNFKRYQLNENNRNSLSNKSVFSLAEDNEQNLWIGTLGSGIDKLDKNRKNFTHFDHKNNIGVISDYILAMQSNKQGDIYASTDQGLIHINTSQEKLSSYFNEEQLSDSLTSGFTSYTIVDSRNWLWLATDQGITIYNPSIGRFYYITTQNGLPNNEITSLVEDKKGMVWAGTRNGLIAISCNTKKEPFDFTISDYDVNDGLPGSSFNSNAVYKDHEGLLYFGTNKGYVCFDPEKISSDNFNPSLRFTELLIANQNIKPNRKYNNRIVITKSIADLNEITLNYKETNFSLVFSAFNYIHSKKIRYKYKLEGLDSGWTETVNETGMASYSNLSHGTYKLTVYARIGNLEWNDTPLVMKIIVKPPFWLSLWSFILYFLLVASIIFYYIKYKLNKQKREFEQTQKILEANKTHEVDELKFKFFTNISHEFKTPLTLILTPLEKLMKTPASDEQRNMFNIMYRNGSNLLNMVNEILDFRKFDLNKMTINKSTGEIISFIREICHSFALLATEKKLKFIFTTHIDELYMEFDPEKTKKIITNLLSNAFKYTKEGGIDVSVAIYEEMNGNTIRYISIRISDTGIGLKEKELEKIFERFYRVESAQESGQSGSGVGLHLTSEYVKLHDGKITVESTEGKGSVFTVQIPIQYPDNLQVKNSTTVLSEGTKRMNELLSIHEKAQNVLRPNLHMLLIVDDNEDFCRFITDLFSENYQVVTAFDGEEASQIVLDRLPDIILCDVMMPKMNGYTFCRLIKEDIRTSHIPVILLTAKSSEDSKYYGIEAGADDYIAKPFNIDLLTLKIAKIIEKQKNIQAHFKKKIDLSPSEIEVTSMDEKFVKKAIAVVEKNIGNSDFLVEDFSKEMAMSRVYFYKKLVSLTDKTPTEFIRFIRIKRAANLLEKSQLFVNEVALQVGFYDPKYFRKYFKEEFGITPNEYKKRFCNKDVNSK